MNRCAFAGIVAGMMCGASVSLAGLPTFEAPVMEIRAQSGNSFGWDGTGFAGRYLLNANNEYLVRGNPGPQLFLGKVGVGGSTIRNMNEVGGFGALNFWSLNSSGDVGAFEADFVLLRGRFAGALSGESYEVIKDYVSGFDVFNVNDIFLAPSGLIGFRESSNLRILDPVADTVTTIYDFDGFQSAQLTLWNDNLTAVARGFLPGNIGQLITVSSSGDKTIIATRDAAANIGNPELYNINNHGDVVFRQTIGGVPTIFFYDAETDTVSPVLAQGQSIGGVTIPTLDFATPSLSDNGLIVFRAGQDIWVTDTDGSDLVRLAGRFDTVTTDLGTTTISGLIGDPQINANGVVVFAASLAQGGSAFFSIVPEPASLALLGLGGLALLRRRAC